MKQSILTIFLSFSLLVSYSMAEDTVETNDTIQTEVLTSDSLSGDETEKEKTLSEQNAEKNAQWFMYGFLALGAFLVIWKIKNNK